MLHCNLAGTILPRDVSVLAPTVTFGVSCDEDSVWELTKSAVDLCHDQHFRASEAFGVNNGDVSACELVGLRPEQYFRLTEAFGADSENVSANEHTSTITNGSLAVSAHRHDAVFPLSLRALGKLYSG